MAADASALAVGGYRLASQSWVGPSVAPLVVVPIATAALFWVLFGLSGGALGFVAGGVFALLTPRTGTLTVMYQRS